MQTTEPRDQIITLDGDELSFIVNVKKDDPIELHPFDFKFTKELI